MQDVDNAASAASTAGKMSVPPPALAAAGVPGAGRVAVDVLREAAAQAGPPQLAVVAATVGPVVEPSDCRVVWVNESCLELLRMDRSDLLGRKLSDWPLDPRRPADQRAGPDEWVRVVVAGFVDGLVEGTARSASGVVTHLDGSRQPVQIRVDRVSLPTPQDSSDRWSGWVVALNPTTELEQAVEQVRAEAEHRFRAVADHAPVGIMVSEVGLRLGFVNDQFARLMDRDIRQLLGVRWLDAVFADDLPGLHEALQIVLAGAGADVVIRVVVRDSQHGPGPAPPRWLQFRLAPVTTPGHAAGFVAVVEDVTARLAREEHLAFHASRDSLTGLVNRRGLLDRLIQLTNGDRAQDRCFAVLFCDLDDFKRINDELGHHAGDQVLVEVASRLTEGTRDEDVVARLAGDEFVVILHGVDTLPAAEAAATHYLHRLCGTVDLNGQRRPLAASLGIALAVATDTADSLLQAADQAMYEAKAAGRGQYRIASRPRRAAAGQ